MATGDKPPNHTESPARTLAETIFGDMAAIETGRIFADGRLSDMFVNSGGGIPEIECFILHGHGPSARPSLGAFETRAEAG